MKNISEISKDLAMFFGEEQGRSLSQILADCIGISKDNIHFFMVIGVLGLIAVLGVIIYLIIRKIVKNVKRKSKS